MLRPIDRFDVDAVLHHFPERAHASELLDVFNNPLNGKVNILIGSKSTDPETNRRMGHIIFRAKSSKDIWRFEGRRGTRTARR